MWGCKCNWWWFKKIFFIFLKLKYGWFIVLCQILLYSIWYFFHFQIFPSTSSKAPLTTPAPSNILSKIYFSISLLPCSLSSVYTPITKWSSDYSNVSFKTYCPELLKDSTCHLIISEYSDSCIHQDILIVLMQAKIILNTLAVPSH